MRKFYRPTFLSLLFLAACNYKVLKEPDSPPDSGKFSDNSTVDAALVQQSVLNSCINCHNGSTDPNLSTIDGIRANQAKILSEVDSNSMPRPESGYSPLTDCQKDILHEWISESMPEKSEKKVMELAHCQQSIPKPPADLPILQMPLNYQTFYTKILQPRCLRCHYAENDKGDDGKAAAEIALYPYSALVAGSKLGSSSDDSKLFSLISTDDEERMPPPDNSEPMLTEDQIKFIKLWLDAGHPE